MRTQEQIDAKIAELKEYQQNVQPTTSFGDDNKARAAAMVKVLEDNMDNDAIYDAFEDKDDPDASMYVMDGAQEARNWLDGDDAALEL
jgi:hypothetical protein